MSPVTEVSEKASPHNLRMSFSLDKSARTNQALDPTARIDSARDSASDLEEL